MRTVDIEKRRIERRTARQLKDTEMQEVERWTNVDSALACKREPESNCCSYGPDGFTCVGPGFGPIHITGDAGRIAFARMTG